MDKDFHDIIDDMIDATDGLDAVQRQAACEQLRLILAKLDHLEDIQPPAGLVQRTMDFIRRHTLPRPSLKHRPTPPHEYEPGDTGRWRWLAGNLRDLIATAAVLTLVFLASRPGLQQMRHVARQNQCAFNMRAIGRAFDSYAASNDGFLPHANANPSTKPWQPGPADLSRGNNTRSLFRLVKADFLQPDALVCPSRPGLRCPTLPSETFRRCEDLPIGYPLGYSILVIQQPERLENLGKDLLAADRNPLFDQPQLTAQHVLDITRLSRLLREQNSPNHNYHGQNLLQSDGGVQFASSRLLPVTQDDIYTIQGTRHYDGTQLPGPGDVFLP